MFGCIRRLGCAVLLFIALAAAWYWYARTDEPAGPPDRARSAWEAVTPEGAERGRLALQSLADARGPGVVSISAGDVASYIFFAASNHLPESARDVQAAVLDDQLAVRGVIPFRELGAARMLGPLASLISESDTVFFSGELSVVQPEVGQYRVRELRIQQLRVPSGLVPRMLRQIDRGDRPVGVSPDALVLPLPAQVLDIRTGNGVVTLYRRAQ